MIKTSTSVIFLFLGTAFVSAGDAGLSYNYLGQDWTGTCATGKRQSPIDIPKSDLGFFNTSKLYNTFLNTASSMESKKASGHRILQNDLIFANSATSIVSISTACLLSRTTETSTTNGFCCA